MHARELQNKVQNMIDEGITKYANFPENQRKKRITENDNKMDRKEQTPNYIS